MDAYEAKFLREALDKMAEAQAALTVAFKIVQYSAVPDDETAIQARHQAMNVEIEDGLGP